VTRRLRDDSGFALMGSLLILVILMGIGLALVSISDTQSNVSGTERVKESGYNLAEAGLNAEALQLGRVWPTTGAATVTCTPTTGSNSYCPLASAIGNGYSAGDYSSSCPTASPAPPLWQTQIRDNGTGTYPQYWTTAVNSQPAYDGNGDGSVWVRAFSTVQCRTTSIVALVTATSMPLTIANTVVTANWFQTTNQGKKVIVDTLGAYAQPPSVRPGPASQPSKVVLRCTAPLGTSPCANYPVNKGQVQPPTVQTTANVSSQALTATQLQALESQAAAAGTLHTGAADCPTSSSALSSPASGAPVVIQGPCNISLGGSNQYNSATTPGVLVIENGTLSLGGTANFYGLIYMVNKQASSGAVVSIGGNATIQGSVNIDGLGGISAGSSKTNLIYDPRATGLLKGSTGAAINRGTVRTLPASTP
jgi:Tfp pilus assembly protein PilX